MRIEGSITFAAAPPQVWSAFTDREALRQATPGCESLQETGPDQYEAVMKVGVAGITGTYKGKLELRDKDEPRRYLLAVQGQGSPGYLQGTATFEFAARDGGTLVTYVWDVQVGGLVASVGQRVLTGVAKMLIGQFFGAMEKQIQARAEQAS